jgi:hypothetical protein
MPPRLLDFPVQYGGPGAYALEESGLAEQDFAMPSCARREKTSADLQRPRQRPDQY